MRDNRYTNMWGEDEEEQKKRREWLRQVYDDAIIPDTDIQTPLNQDNTINNDKYKHAYISCEGAKSGLVGAATIAAMGVGKEINDIVNKTGDYIKGNNKYQSLADILVDSAKDLYADGRGLYLGYNNPDDDCDDLISKIYPRYLRR
ncbi:MAG: hypothetical protein E7019_06345 [Alphaproteobacteria bacterium]|nr:hypothetical protein [Alphaproteobacteria bacterium]